MDAELTCVAAHPAALLVVLSRMCWYQTGGLSRKVGHSQGVQIWMAFTIMRSPLGTARVTTAVSQGIHIRWSKHGYSQQESALLL